MAEKPQETTPAPDHAGELRRTLIRRLAVAAVLVAVLLGVLAFFDYLANNEEPEPPVYTKPVPVPPRKEVTQPVKPAETLPEPPTPEKPAEAPAQPEATTKPEAPPKPETPPKPEVQAKPQLPTQPAPPAKPELRPEPKPTAKPSAPAGKPVPPTEPEATAPPAIRPEPQPAPVAPVPKAVAPVVPAPHPLRLFSGYVLQAGVFTSMQRAEELHAQLTLNGIASTLEARVQVGPFKTKEEALAARQKLQALGISSVLIPPKP